MPDYCLVENSRRAKRRWVYRPHVKLGLLGRAQGHVQTGRTLRIESTVLALKDPRTYDWPQMSTYTRGYLEYLVEYQADGSLAASLFAGSIFNEDSTEYTLFVRPGGTWSNGVAFTAQDVLFNIAWWYDSSDEGNSMASRMDTLVDKETGQRRAGAMIVIDDLTLRLVLGQPDIMLIAGFSDYPMAILHSSF